MSLGIDPAAPLWIEGAHDSDTNCSSIRSSAASSDGSFQAKLDFASAVAKAAQMSGLTVVNAPPLTSISAKDREKGLVLHFRGTAMMICVCYYQGQLGWQIANLLQKVDSKNCFVLVLVCCYHFAYINTLTVSDENTRHKMGLPRH